MRAAVRSALVLALAGVAVSCTFVDTGGLLQTPADTPRALDRQTIADGLREALRVGAERTVDRTAAVDGFLANELIRIAIPERLDSMMQTLRTIGLDRQVDEFEVAMNRAAEQAAGEAREVFWQEIRELTIPQAVEILRGESTAATDYLRAQTSDELRARFRPIVERKMDQVGLARQYSRLAEIYNSIPLTTSPALDLDDYVTDEALDGLFTVLGEEEAKIRADPVARTTELLRRVFGRR